MNAVPNWTSDLLYNDFNYTWEVSQFEFITLGELLYKTTFIWGILWQKIYFLLELKLYCLLPIVYETDGEPHGKKVGLLLQWVSRRGPGSSSPTVQSSGPVASAHILTTHMRDPGQSHQPSHSWFPDLQKLWDNKCLFQTTRFGGTLLNTKI